MSNITCFGEASGEVSQDIETSDLVTGVKSCHYYQAKLRQIARWAVWMLMLRCLVEKQLWSRTINQSCSERKELLMVKRMRS